MEAFTTDFINLKIMHAKKVLRVNMVNSSKVKNSKKLTH